MKPEHTYEPRPREVLIVTFSSPDDSDDLRTVTALAYKAKPTNVKVHISDRGDAAFIYLAGKIQHSLGLGDAIVVDPMQGTCVRTAEYVHKYYKRSKA